MDHYFDIRLLPDADFTAPVLLNALYTKLHRVLVLQQETGIGVSFPLYQAASESAEGQKLHAHFGLTLRLHGDKEALTRLMDTRWLRGFVDYTMTGNILPVPEDAHLIRVIRRKGLSESEAAQLISNRPAPKLNWPFITLDSVSTGL